MRFHLEPRHWFLIVFVASALYVHFRGRERFGLLRAMTDFTIFLAPFNALMYLFSRAPSTPYLDPKTFPDLVPLAENWRTIREEALRLGEGGHIKAASGYNDIGFNSFFRTGWERFYLKWYGEDLPSAERMCPKTVELVRRIPAIKAAMFASLPPGAKLTRHRDPYAGSLRYHLGLATPNAPGCYIMVDGQPYHWRDGEAIMFDETFIHYAENTTQDQRVILFCDVERPLHFAPLRWFNRFFARYVMTASATKNVEGERVGVLNKAFGYVYQVRIAGKKLKAKSRSAYYALKWAAIGGLLYLAFF